MIILKKIVVALLGGTVLLAGLAMIVLPGPAVVVIPAALAILAVEFLWARRWLNWLRERFKTILPNKPASNRKLNPDNSSTNSVRCVRFATRWLTISRQITREKLQSFGLKAPADKDGADEGAA